MKQYLDLVRHVLDHGVKKGDRTGTGTLSVFGYQMRFDLARRLPAGDHQEAAPQVDRSTSCSGSSAASTNVRWLQEHGVTIWDEWADADGELGPVYGAPVALAGRAGRRHHRSDRARHRADQEANPDSRRLIVSAWNVAEVER